MKEIIRRIFGPDAANDKDIVSFYKQVHKKVVIEYAKKKCKQQRDICAEHVSNDLKKLIEDSPAPNFN